MNESKKLLIGFGVVLAVCACTAGVAFFAVREFGKKMGNAFEGDPTSVARIQEEIAEFNIPSGYKPLAINMFNYDMVTLMPTSSRSGMSIMLMQYTGLISGNSQQMEEQLRRAMSEQNNQPGMSMKVVETHDEVIRQKTVTVTISESEYQGITMRQWTTVFEGNKGPTILMVQGVTEAWDQQLLNDFIKSIK